MAALNHEHGLRSFLAKWHPLLQAHAATCPAGMSAKEHEDKRERVPEFHEEFDLLAGETTTDAQALASAAGVSDDGRAPCLRWDGCESRMGRRPGVRSRERWRLPLSDGGMIAQYPAGRGASVATVKSTLGRGALAFPRTPSGSCMIVKSGWAFRSE